MKFSTCITVVITAILSFYAGTTICTFYDYVLFCLRYILHNPVAAELVSDPADWEFSNCQDLLGLRNGTLCNKQLIYEELSLDINSLEEILRLPPPLEDLDNIW